MAWTEPRAKGYRGCYRGLDNKIKKTGTVPSKRAAVKLAQDAEAQIRAGTWHDPSAGQLTFSVYFEEHWLPNRLREKNTVAAYRSHYNSSLREGFGHLEVRKITTPVIQRWVTQMVRSGTAPGADSHPLIGTSDQTLPGPAKPTLRPDPADVKNPVPSTR